MGYCETCENETNRGHCACPCTDDECDMCYPCGVGAPKKGASMGKELKIELSENMGVGDDDKPKEVSKQLGLVGSWLEKLWKKRSSSDGSKTP